VIIPEEREGFESGEMVDVDLFRPIEEDKINE
jgi:hypothetical protein